MDEYGCAPYDSMCSPPHIICIHYPLLVEHSQGQVPNSWMVYLLNKFISIIFHGYVRLSEGISWYIPLISHYCKSPFSMVKSPFHLVKSQLPWMIKQFPPSEITISHVFAAGFSPFRSEASGRASNGAHFSARSAGAGSGWALDRWSRCGTCGTGDAASARGTMPSIYMYMRLLLEFWAFHYQ